MPEEFLFKKPLVKRPRQGRSQAQIDALATVNENKRQAKLKQKRVSYSSDMSDADAFFSGEDQGMNDANEEDDNDNDDRRRELLTNKDNDNIDNAPQVPTDFSKTTNRRRVANNIKDVNVQTAKGFSSVRRRRDRVRSVKHPHFRSWLII